MWTVPPFWGVPSVPSEPWPVSPPPEEHPEMRRTDAVAAAMYPASLFFVVTGPDLSVGWRHCEKQSIQDYMTVQCTTVLARLFYRTFFFTADVVTRSSHGGADAAPHEAAVVAVRFAAQRAAPVSVASTPSSAGTSRTPAGPGIARSR